LDTLIFTMAPAMPAPWYFDIVSLDTLKIRRLAQLSVGARAAELRATAPIA
jgi:hypothetical protein